MRARADVLQLLERAGCFTLWCKWGRVGETSAYGGDHSDGTTKHAFANAAAAVKAFEKKFFGDRAGAPRRPARAPPRTRAALHAPRPARARPWSR